MTRMDSMAYMRPYMRPETRASTGFLAGRMDSMDILYF